MKLRYKLPGGRKRLLRDWIAALRSGEYKQCRKMYESGYKTFCAVGLLNYISGSSHAFPSATTFLNVERTAVIYWNDEAMYDFNKIANNLEILYG